MRKALFTTLLLVFVALAGINISCSCGDDDDSGDHTDDDTGGGVLAYEAPANEAGVVDAKDVRGRFAQDKGQPTLMSEVMPLAGDVMTAAALSTGITKVTVDIVLADGTLVGERVTPTFTLNGAPVYASGYYDDPNEDPLDPESGRSGWVIYPYGAAPNVCNIGGQEYQDGDLNPLNSCEECDPAVSTSAWTDLADGATCADNLFCNGADTCGGGTCSTHSGDPCPSNNNVCDGIEACNEPSDNCATLVPLNCDDANACTTDSCNPASGCQYVNNTAACEDMLFCNGADTCGGGTCSTHSGDPCPSDNNVCNGVESCNETTDACTTTGALNCLDGNVCTDDSCNPVSGCQFVNNTAACEDMLFCNGTDTCASGACSTHSGDPCQAGGGYCVEAGDSCIYPTTTTTPPTTTTTTTPPSTTTTVASTTTTTAPPVTTTTVVTTTSTMTTTTTIPPPLPECPAGQTCIYGLFSEVQLWNLQFDIYGHLQYFWLERGDALPVSESEIDGVQVFINDYAGSYPESIYLPGGDPQVVATPAQSMLYTIVLQLSDGTSAWAWLDGHFTVWGGTIVNVGSDKRIQSDPFDVVSALWDRSEVEALPAVGDLTQAMVRTCTYFDDGRSTCSFQPLSVGGANVGKSIYLPHTP